MKLSIFTPTNNPERILLPYNSIKNQTQNFDVEWIIVPNCNVDLPSYFYNTPWIRIIRCPNGINTIGGLKKFACEQATGDVLIELDHDDELLPNALKVIYNALINEKDAFLFSDAIYIKSNNKSPLFSSAYGWQNYIYQDYPINKTFAPTARSLSEIFFAPDHVRVWTRHAYDKAGKHDEALLVGDDHDLIIKTYLAKTKFIQIEKPLYKYYVHGGNSWLQNCDAVQEQQAKNRDKYLRPLIQEWCRRENLITINFPSADFSKYQNTKDQIGCIIANDTISSIEQGKNVVHFMNNIYNMLVPGGWFLVDVASTDGRGAFCDPMHISYWNRLSFRYYTDRSAAKYVENIKCRFQQVVLEDYFPNQWCIDNKVPYVRSDLCALKGQIQPGQCLI